MNSSVPTEWITDELARFCDIVGGGTPDRAVHEYWGGQIPWVSPTEVTSLVSKYISKTKESLTQLGLDKSSAKLHPPGTLLMTSRASIGYVAINTVPMATNQGFQSLRCKDGTLTDYMYQYITWVRPELERLSAGSTFSEISSVNVKRLRVTLPPLPEQQKIATILSSVDDVIEKIRAQIDKLKDLKTGMMQELLTKGIGHTEFKDSPVGRIPISWSISDMRSLCSVVTKGTTPTSLGHSYKESGINFIKVESIIRNGIIDPNKFSYIDEAANKSLARSVLYAGDILITIAGATVGKLAIVNESHLPANTNQALSIVRVNPSKANRLFLYYWLQSGYIVDQVWSIQTVGAQPNLSLAQVGEFSVPLPSIEEQNQITCQLIALDRKESLISTKLAGLVNLKKALMQDLLTGKVRVNLTDKESAVV